MLVLLRRGAAALNDFSMVKIDAHQHFWKYSAADYGWINDSMAVLKRDFLPADLRALLRSNGFDGSIAVQARQSVEETRWLLALADQNEFIQGVVGWVDLCSPAVGDQLRQFAEHRKLVAVRHVVQDEPADRFMLRHEFQRGIAQLAEFGLVYDMLLYPRHLPVAVELVREFPDQAFVLDHIAKPPIGEGTRPQIDAWTRDIEELAKFPNVACKLSGMVTEAKWRRWNVEDFRPYLDVVLKAFGASRLMIGSDWPVCTLSADYASTLGIVRKHIESLSASDQVNILGANCARVYGVR